MKSRILVAAAAALISGSAAIAAEQTTQTTTTTTTTVTTTTPAPAAAPALSEALQKAVADFKAAKKSPYPASFVVTSENVTPDGKTFVPVLLYVPKSSGLASQSVTFFGLVEDASGKSIAAFEEPSKLTATKDDFFIDKSLSDLPAGKAHGVFGIADANGKVLTMASTDLTLSGAIDKSAEGASALILSNNVYPLTEKQQPDAPFSFGGLKIVPKGDKVFHKSEQIFYSTDLRNPSVSDSPVNADGTVTVNAPAAGEPKVQMKVDLEGKTASGQKVHTGAPLSVVPAAPVKDYAGHYLVGSAIPGDMLPPGDYKMTITVIDTTTKASYTLSDTFRIID